jgi:hypothetical protein
MMAGRQAVGASFDDAPSPGEVEHGLAIGFVVVGGGE